MRDSRNIKNWVGRSNDCFDPDSLGLDTKKYVDLCFHFHFHPGVSLVIMPKTNSYLPKTRIKSIETQ
jgi:hypothetical protein